MRHLALLAVVLWSGCLDSQDECGDCFGYLELSWRIEKNGMTNLPCPAGFDQMHVFIDPQPLSEWHQIVDCNAMEMPRRVMDGGYYDLGLVVTNREGEIAFQAEERLDIGILGSVRKLEVVLH